MEKYTVTHQGKQCNTKTNTAQNLKIYIRGVHGQGWVAHCGEKFKWPPKFHKHQTKCDACKKMKAKSDKTKDKLMTKIKRQQACK